jgi:hypothetical protein
VYDPKPGFMHDSIFVGLAERVLRVLHEINMHVFHIVAYARMLTGRKFSKEQPLLLVEAFCKTHDLTPGLFSRTGFYSV